MKYDLKDVKLHLFAIDHVVSSALNNPKKGGDKQNEESSFCDKQNEES
jgi:hypothetical protein